jgi:hypothetical protein
MEFFHSFVKGFQVQYDPVWAVCFLSYEDRGRNLSLFIVRSYNDRFFQEFVNFFSYVSTLISIEGILCRMFIRVMCRVKIDF